MPESLRLNDFSAGWTPGADPINGAKNGLLKMESVELDQQGALRMSGGVSNITNFSFAADAHTIYAKYLGGVLYHYLGLKDGSVMRGSSAIVAAAGGSNLRTAFAAAFGYVFIMSGAAMKRDDGSTTTNTGVQAPSALTVATGGAGVLNDTYQYAQMNVQNFGNGYVAKSPLFLATTNPTTFVNQVATVTIQDPTAGGGTGNEVWIFRRSTGTGNLSQWTRVYRQTAGPWNPITDNLLDIDAISGNVFANEFLATVNSTNIPEFILQSVGLINGRMVYFSPKFIYFSEINSPDTYDTRTSIGYGGNQNAGAEIFLWAVKFGENLIVYGTTADIYLLSGTFTSNPDGTLDVYQRSSSVDNPPISISVAKWQNNIIYMSADGWRIFNVYFGSNETISSPTLDRQYRGETLQGYGGVPIFLYPTTDSGGVLVQYFGVVCRNKLWTLVPHIVNNNTTLPYTYYLQVYDFIRKSWRVLPNIKPVVIADREDDSVLGFFDDAGGKQLRLIDDHFSNVFSDGVTQQTVNVQTLFHDFGTPRNRKLIHTIRFMIDTGNAVLNGTLAPDDDAGGIFTLQSNGLSEVDLPVNLSFHTVQLQIQGQCPTFRLSQVIINYDEHPIQNTSFFLLRQEFSKGNYNKKRVRTWPIVINTLGHNVQMVPVIDGIGQPALTINTNGKTTVLYQWNTDVIGTDFAVTFTSLASPPVPFEIWEILEPDIVEVVPLAKRFWQSGPVELFGSSFIRRLELRAVAFGTSIPWKLYLGDISPAGASGAFTTVNGVDDSYYVEIPRFDQNNSGRVFRLELGSTAFDFHPYYVRALLVRSGSNKDSETEWVDLNSEKNG